MKKGLILFCVLFTSIISLHYSSGPASSNGQGFTGAPGENGTLCGNCHTGGAFGTPSATLVITNGIGDVVTSYTAGETYQVSLTAMGSSGSPTAHGFQLTVLDASDADVADFSNPSSNAKISTAANVASGRTYAEHNGPSVSNNFTIDWVAPNSGTGDLTFHYAVNLVDGTGGTSNDNGSLGFSSSMSESPPLVKVVGALEVNDAFTFPTSDGSADQVLTTDGMGNVSWMDIPSALINNSTSNDRQAKMQYLNVESIRQKVEMEALKDEVKLLKKEIEELKKMIKKLTE